MPGEVALHVGREDRAAGGGRLLGDDLEGPRLAGPGGARDQPVAVEERQRQGDVDRRVRRLGARRGHRPAEVDPRAVEAVARRHLLPERLRHGATTILSPPAPDASRCPGARAVVQGDADQAHGDGAAHGGVGQAPVAARDVLQGLAEDREAAQVQPPAAKRPRDDLGGRPGGAAHLHDPPAAPQRADRRDRGLAPERVDHEVGALAAHLPQRRGEPGPGRHCDVGAGGHGPLSPVVAAGGAHDPRGAAVARRPDRDLADAPARPEHDDRLARQERAALAHRHPAGEPGDAQAGREREAQVRRHRHHGLVGHADDLGQAPGHGQAPDRRPGGVREGVDDLARGLGARDVRRVGHVHVEAPCGDGQIDRVERRGPHAHERPAGLGLRLGHLGRLWRCAPLGHDEGSHGGSRLPRRTGGGGPADLGHAAKGVPRRTPHTGPPMTPRHHETHDAAGVWVPCATCWGQRRLLTAAADGALVPTTCPGCLGVGERLAGSDQVPAPTP